MMERDELVKRFVEVVGQYVFVTMDEEIDGVDDAAKALVAVVEVAGWGPRPAPVTARDVADLRAGAFEEVGLSVTVAESVGVVTTVTFIDGVVGYVLDVLRRRGIVVEGGDGAGAGAGGGVGV